MSLSPPFQSVGQHHILFFAQENEFVNIKHCALKEKEIASFQILNKI